MKRRKIALGIGLFFLGTLLAFLVFGVDVGSSGSDDQTRGGATFATASECKTCHEATYVGWNATGHAEAWIDLQASGQAEPRCEQCHVTGWGQPGGFVNNTTTPQLVDVQCEECHGPGSDHISALPQNKRSTIVVNYSADLCGSCHQTEHYPFFVEWGQSGHSESLPRLLGAKDVNDSCLGCHSADYILEDDSDLKPTKDTAKESITCAVCHNPHSAAYDDQLRMPKDQLCASCHNPGTPMPGEPIYHPQSSMREGKRGVDVTSDIYMPTVTCADCHMYHYTYNASRIPAAVTGHSFRPKPEACADCHNGVSAYKLSVEESATLIQKWQTETRDLLLEVQYKIGLAHADLLDAPDYGFGNWTLQQAQKKYDEANYSKNFVVADGSGGVHNPKYAKNLLLFAKMRATEVIDMLTPGTVVGKIVDEENKPVAGAEIEKDGVVWATTNADGEYMFKFATGTHNFDVTVAGKKVGSIQGVEIAADQTTNVGTTTVSLAPRDLTVLYVGIGVIVLAAAALFVYFKVLRKKKIPPTE